MCCGSQGAKARLAKAEQALESVLDAHLGFQRNDGSDHEEEDSSSSGFPANFKDDYVDSDAEASSSDDDDVKATSSKPANGKYTAKKQRLDAEGADDIASQHDEDNWEVVIDDSNPPSFSQVDLSRPETEIQTQHPLFPVSPYCHLLLSRFWECTCRQPGSISAV